MVSRLKQTLRIAALEDLLHHHLGLSIGTARHLARIAWESARGQQLDLRGPTLEQLQESFFLIMFYNGYSDLLDRVAIESPAFTVALTRFVASDALEDQRAA